MFIQALSTRCHRSDFLALSYLFRDGVPPQAGATGERPKMTSLDDLMVNRCTANGGFYICVYM